MLAFAQQRGAGEDDGQDGDVVDDLDHPEEPATFQVAVEQRAAGQTGDLVRALLGGVVQFALENPADVAGAHEGLTHGRGIDIDLQRRLAPGQQIGLEVGRHIDHEGVAPAVQCRVHVCIADQCRRLELGLLQGFGQSAGQAAVVFVDKGHAGIVHADHRAGRRHVDGHAEGIQEKQQQYAVVPQAGQLLQAQPVDVRQLLHLRSPASSAAPPTAARTSERSPAAPDTAATAPPARGPW